AQEISQLLQYDPNSAGGLMNPRFISLTQDMTVEQVINRLRAESPSAESIFYLYVVDNEHHLTGVLNLRHLIITNPETPINRIMLPNPIKVKEQDRVEQIAELMEKHNLLALPVVDEQNRIKGVITVDDVFGQVVSSSWKMKIKRR
ncbi:MAG: CBS domain-containing protein, partial [bacterium]|nr:CBS domain-containing protein [bacterium]